MNADGYVRVVLSPAARQRREYAPGLGAVGGTPFFDGVAYVPRVSTLAARLRSGQWHGAELQEADPEGLAAYLARVEDMQAPKATQSKPCHPARYVDTPRYVPAYCHGGHQHGTGCRELYPANFPPTPESVRPGRL